MTADPAQMTIAEAAAALSAGELTASELTQACLERVDAADKQVRAWAYLDADQAHMEARLLDSTAANSILHGIPFAAKDIIDTADMPTCHGTPIFQHQRPARDAATVALLKEAGALCLGKTVTTELAHFHPGKTRNPHAPTHTPGGSSSGSAAAVAACMVPFALGTQTTGSVLRPASYCGVFGFKPSFGDVNRSGVFECSASFDTVGWFTRSVEDLEIVRRALLRMPEKSLQPVAPSQLRVGFFRGPHWQAADVHTQQLIESIAQQMDTLTQGLEEVATPSGFVEIADHHRTIAGYEFARAISWERTQRGHRLSPKLLNGRCEDGLRSSYEQYAQAQASLAQWRRDIEQITNQYDLLITPAAPGEAWPGLQATGDPVFNTAWTALHLPAMSIPVARGSSGLPVGLQLVGGFRRDEQLLASAQSICQALGVAVVAAI